MRKPANEAGLLYYSHLRCSNDRSANSPISCHVVILSVQLVHYL
jgi:hypothetical protein